MKTSANKFRGAAFYIVPVLGFAACGWLWLQVLKPGLLNFITEQLPRVNSAQEFVIVEAGKIDLSLLKLQLTAYDVKVSFKNKELKLEPVSIGSVSAQLDIFNLIIGQVNLSKVVVDKARWSYEIVPDPDKKPLTHLPVDEIFKHNSTIPVDRFFIYNTEITLTEPGLKTRTLLTLSQVALTNKNKLLGFSAENIGAEISQGEKSFTCSTHFNISLSPELLSVSDFEIQALNSQVSITGQFKNVQNFTAALAGSARLKSKVNLEDLRTLALILVPQKKRIPAVSGFVETNGDLSFSSPSDLKGDVNINTSQVALDHFKLGQAAIHATIYKNQIEINEVKLEHSSGNAILKNVKIEQKPPYYFNTNLEFSDFDLQKLFVSLGMTDVPAGFLAFGKARCEGLLSPSPIVNCNIDTDAKDIWVKSDQKNPAHILKIKQAGATAEAKLTKEAISYQAKIRIGNSSGHSQGIIDFKDGFNVDFETEKLDFNDVDSLADLNVKGEMKISGKTTGDSNHGTIAAAVSMTNAELDGFRIGNFSSALDYRDLQLKFSDYSGAVGKSELSGYLNFNFDQEQIEGNFKSSSLRGEDVLFILNKRFALPFDFFGQGRASMVLNGPFNFWNLKYTLRSEFTNGTLAGEKFDKLTLNLDSTGQRVEFTDVRLRKLKSDFKVDGVINTAEAEPQFNLKIRANPFLLEENDHVIRYAPSIAGLGYAEGAITGPLKQPEILANFTLKQVSYDKVEYPNSQGEIRIDKDFFRFNGQFFGRQIQSDILWPWDEKNSFSAKILVHDLNPLFLLPLISVPQPSSDFHSRLNAEIDLTSKNRNLSMADGFIKITDFLLQRGTQSLKLEKPASLVFKSGLSQMEPVSLKGEDSSLSVTMSHSSSGNVRLNVMADLQLRLFHFLVPFAQALSGNLVIDSQVLLKDDSFELFGEGELTDGLVNLKGFPKPIENINSPIEFSKSKIFLNDITGQLGQSDVTGAGHIDIVGSKNIVVSLRAIADNVELNFPDKILTAGKATVLFSGNWLPYNLKVDYIVSHGLVEKDFEEDATQGLSLKASSFLPPQQIEQLSPSLSLDINVDLMRGIIIKNKLLEGEAVGQLQIQGTPESPSIRGRIDIKQGSKLIFKDTPFEIQTASVIFQQTKEINPDIYVSANSRVSDYDINLLVQGPAKNVSIKPTSQPPLSKEDIFSLLALGFTSQNDQNLSSDTQQKQTGIEVLAQITNKSELNKKFQEKLGLTVQLAPSVDSTKNIAVPKVVVSKKISNKLNASYSKPFTGNDQNQEIKLQYLYNNKVSVIMNYQNKDTAQQDQISNTNNNSKGILGLDLEYRDEFK